MVEYTPYPKISALGNRDMFIEHGLSLKNIEITCNKKTDTHNRYLQLNLFISRDEIMNRYNSFINELDAVISNSKMKGVLKYIKPDVHSITDRLYVTIADDHIIPVIDYLILKHDLKVCKVYYVGDNEHLECLLSEERNLYIHSLDILKDYKLMVSLKNDKMFLYKSNISNISLKNIIKLGFKVVDGIDKPSDLLNCDRVCIDNGFNFRIYSKYITDYITISSIIKENNGFYKMKHVEYNGPKFS